LKYGDKISRFIHDSREELKNFIDPFNWDLYKEYRMKRIISTISSQFRYKLMASYLLIALVPFILFAVVSVSVSINHSRQVALSHMSQLVRQVSGSIDSYISALDETADYISDVTCDLYTNARGSGDWTDMHDGLQTALRDVAETHKEIFGVLIAFADDQYIAEGIQRVSRAPLIDTQWYLAAKNNPDKMLLLSDFTGRNVLSDSDYSAEGMFSVVKAITDRETGAQIGVVLLDIRHELIKNSIDRVSIGQQGFVFVMDTTRKVVYAPINDVVYRIEAKGLDDKKVVTAAIKGQDYLIGSEASAYTGWMTVGVFPIEEVMGGVNQIYLILICFIISNLLVVILISFQIAGSVTKPIRYLRALIKEAEAGDLSVRFESKNSDEVSDLGLSFNQLLDRVNLLITQVTEEQQSKREAELKSLQEQIKPHFLYNTLDTVVWIARSHSADDIVQIVTAMTSMFRIGLSKGSDIITVNEEVAHVKNYMYIQGVRYKDRVNFVIHIDKGIFDSRVPKLILQPLAENAIYHGIKRKRDSGLIEINGGFSDNGGIWLSVRDDGAGISPEKLQSLNERLKKIGAGESVQETFGIFFIQRRLILAYGAAYGLTFTSDEGKGTTATVTMPFQK
jgi:two-component system sensor histidine kinase YesM